MPETTIKEKVKSLIKRGTGEAYLILKKNPKINFSKEVLKAALKNLAYDPQCEGSRATYVSGLINLTGKKDELVKAILKALATERSDGWSLNHLFALAAIFAKEGNKKAKKAIYERFHRKIIKRFEFSGDDEIIEIDGLKGLRYIAGVKGRLVAGDPERWEDGFLVDYFQKDNPSIKVYDELEKWAECNVHIKVYLNAIKKSKPESSKREQPKYDYETVKQQIENQKYVSPFITKHMSDADVKKIVNDFLNETNRLKQEKFLRLFSRVKFPYDDYQPILKIAKGTNSKKDRLVEFAVEALQYFSGDDIRQLAIEKLNKTTRPDDYVKLLVSNYRDGDSQLLTTIANKYKDEEIIHSLVCDYVAVYKANQTKDCKKPLEAIYDKLTCGLHRADIVRILIENDVLSDKIYREIKYDSYEEIRKLHQNVLETA